MVYCFIFSQGCYTCVMVFLSTLKSSLLTIYCRSGQRSTNPAINSQKELLLSQMKDMEAKADIFNAELAEVSYCNLYKVIVIYGAFPIVPTCAMLCSFLIGLYCIIM